jgi:hypothetical protein
MLETIELEKNILQNLRQLSPEQQQQVLDFITTLSDNTRKSPKLSLQQIANLPLSERHQYLAQFVPAMTDDFLLDPELTEFNVLDTEDWDLDHD